ncbi:nitrate/nitrite transporter NrtS [Bradyrhizobium erythrophlei]|uniref:nitrate/nitrite transporter NrtS n=1 Tax=Bradyrhizobium erythrophlei TaxID=1437360 RepID=UPI0035EE8783
MSTFRLGCRYAFSDGVPRRSFLVAVVVGTVLNLINQGDALFGAMPINWFKVILTYFVPYAVCTYGAVSIRIRNPPR